jgi:asparagine synthase (glutamine-hydrolysing)
LAGIGGWYGLASPDAPAILTRFARRLGALDGNPAQSMSGRDFALAAAGNQHTAALVSKRDATVAIHGHPRWEGAGKVLTQVDEVALALLGAYRERGPECLDDLRGDFALAVCDTVRGELLLALDRIAIGDLVYQQADGGIVFGATCDVLAEHPSSSRRVDLQSVYDYAFFHMVPGPATIFSGVERVPPGGYVLFADGRAKVGSYWRMRFIESGDYDFASLKEDLLRSLRNGVRAGAGADGVVCGAFLSGGTDSSTVSGLLGEVTGRPARTFSIGFAATGYDETEYARIAARHFGTEHREYYVSPEDVVEAVPRIAAAYDQPFGNASAIPTYHCARFAASAGVTRLLAGDGGDELFAGNARYATQQLLALYETLPDPLRRLVIEPLALRLPVDSLLAPIRKVRSYVAQAAKPLAERYEAYNLLERLGPETVFTGAFLSEVDRGRPIARLEEPLNASGAISLINRLQAIDLKITLADNDLRKVARMCELAKVDVVFPMLHEDVVDVSARVPPRLKLKGRRLRYFFKEALRGFLPDEILRKQKHGFGLPVGAWLVSHAPLRALAGDALATLRRRRVVRPEFIDRLLSEHLPAHPAYYGTMVWLLMMLELWIEAHDVSL